MRRVFSGSLRAAGSKGSPSWVLPVSKNLVGEGKIVPGRTYEVVFSDDELEKAQSNVIEQNRAELEMLKRSVNALTVALNEVGRDVSELRKQYKYRLGGR